MSSGNVSPSPTPSASSVASTHAPKYGTPVPNRIFVGGIVSNTTEDELKTYFSAFGAVKDTKIITDRGGVSRGYGFVTFETQEDAEKIIKKDADNLIFKDRKLNIGPAVRKQQTTQQRSLSDIASMSPGTLMFTNGVPYTYHNGTAIFHIPESGFPAAAMHPPQAPYSTLMLPQHQAVYLQQYPAHHYQQAVAPQYAAGQLRWAPQAATAQTIAASNPGYLYPAIHASPDFVYAQAAQGYPTDLSDTAIIDGTPVEGMFCLDHLTTSRTNYTSEQSSVEHTTVPQKTAAMFPMQVQSKTQSVPPTSALYKYPTAVGAGMAQYTAQPYSLPNTAMFLATSMVPGPHIRAAAAGCTPLTILTKPNESGDGTCEALRVTSLTPPPTPNYK